MLQTVTAILVVRSGSTRVQRTLESLRAQTRRPDAVVVIETASDGSASPAVADFGPTQYLATKERLSFPAAVSAAVRALDEPAGPEQWLWLLAQDTAPEPEALERLMAVGEVSPSVAVAGPKLVEWDDRTRLRGYGVSMTRTGTTVPLVEDELDQGQHDNLSDVLGVHEAGMLVRHSVFSAVGGLDLGLPVVDGGVDFCVRVRLAGHRVVVAPGARVAVGGDGVVGPRLSRRTGAVRVSYRVRRLAQLHRRLAYAPAGALLWHWLTLVPFAVGRSVGWLLAKRPGAVGGELAAAFQAAFGGGHVGTARRNVARARRKAPGWAAIAPLRMPAAEVRRRRMLAREAALTLAHGDRRELDFFGTGGGWVVLAALVASVGLQGRLLGASVIGGGGLLPLDSTPSALWSGVGWGWRDVGIGFTGPSDPFQAVLALLGSLTFWQPSFSLVLLWFAAMPLAALGAWLLAARFTRRAAPRAVFALVWAFAPPLLVGLSAGRPAAVLAHVLLPWLVFAAVAARSSWSASGAAALLAAGLAACAPSLTPALALAWLVWTALSGRAVFRALFVPVPAIALFLPLALTQLGNGHPLRVFADPGLPVPSAASPTWQLLLGIPGGRADAWQLFDLPADTAQLLLLVLFAPIAVLALLALFLRPSLYAGGALFGALLGLATAVVASHTALQTVGAQTVGLWTGSGLSLYWLGAAGAATLGLTALGRFSVGPAWVTAVAVLVAVVPLALAAPLGRAAVTATASGRLPAYVSAEADSQPRTATLVLAPLSSGAVTAGLVHGAGVTLDRQSTVASTGGGRAGDAGVARLAVNLASRSGYDASVDLKRYGISFVFLDIGSAPGLDRQALADRASAALDADPLLTRVGNTANGSLWSTTTSVAPVAIPANPGGWRQPMIVLMLTIVFGVFALLSIPTGRAGTAAPRARRPRATPPSPAAAPTTGQTVPEPEASDPEGDVEDDPAPAPELELEVEGDEREPAFVGGRRFDEDVES